MTQEKEIVVKDGWGMLVLAIISWLLTLGAFIQCMLNESFFLGVAGVLLLITAGLLSWGLFSLQPNEARILVLFGDYKGTVRKDGFHWANPFSVHRIAMTVVAPDPSKPGTQTLAKQPNRYIVSLRARNFETQVLKVNDQRGNPIEISAVVVWRVKDTAQALFDVDDYQDYVRVQSETAVRHLANCYPYDHGNDGESEGEITLRDNTDTISNALQKELQERLSKAGVVVEEARLTHLAYAPEIASAMLRRQQAEAIISARQKIVQGAVGMVEMALTELANHEVLNLDEEKKAAMVSNLLVVLCGDHQVDPVINTGTLYH